ncbi:aminotransferase class IV [Staphylococcus equorum]|uniref:Aminotransferase class IV n=1 Tax=Staphylococcus equorum TaxID=246432 RepID=A0A9X4L9U2_9STAP|nr:aminotransferase class IV [Staphylococcus equorum]MDG0842753.1 aminotransferase class IV [Staphylococcus equorum]MDG0859625.1 aminotransferase class IV [Staphylococcus equorum]
MQLFETMRLEKGKFPRLPYHTKRIKQSAERLNFKFDEANWNQLIEMLINEHPTGAYRIKILLDQDGLLDYVVAALSDKNKFTAKLLLLPDNINKPELINKTTVRKHLSHNHQTDLVLLYDSNEKLLEFDIGNLMIKEDGRYYTPIYNQDFLRGCMRQSLIDDGKLSQKNYDLNDFKDKVLRNQIQVFLINSLREVAEVEIYL